MDSLEKIKFTSQTAWETQKQLNSNFEKIETAIDEEIPTKTSGLINDGDGQSYQIHDGYESFSTTSDYVGYYVLVNDNYTKVTPTNKDSLSITAGTTIAYELSPFATEEYVRLNGGKIDSISVNNIPQTIDANKNVDITVPTQASDVHALPDSTKYGASLSVSGTSVQLKDQDGNNLGSAITTQDTGATSIETAVGYSSAKGYSSFTSVDEYVGYYVEYNSEYTLVTNDNKSSLNITAGTTVAYTQGNAVTGSSYDSSSRKITLTKGETFVKLKDVDAALSTSSSNPVENKVVAVLIPNAASSSNQLADKEFVNSSIATNTANFIGTFANISELKNYSGTVTNNDYAFVSNSVVQDNGNDFANTTDLNAYDKTLLTNFDYAWVINGSKFDLYRFDIINQTWGLRVANTAKEDVTLNTAYNRYKATVSGSTITWEFEYTLNNSSFTAAQWAAINSGITESLVSKLTGIEAGAEVNDVDGVEIDGSSIVDGNKIAQLATINGNYNASTNKLATESDLVDTGATSVEVIGSGNVVDSASYDDTTRKLTLTKGITALTAQDALARLTFTASDAGWSAQADADGFYTLTITSTKTPLIVFNSNGEQITAGLKSDGTYVYIVTDTKMAGSVLVG